MSTRAAPLLLLSLAACGPSTADQATLAKVEAAQQEGIEEDGRVRCARGSEALANDCTIERTAGKDGLILTIRHADGAFRRLLVTRDGRGVVAADGAEPARVTVLSANRIAVAIAADRYELPATVQAGGPAANKGGGQVR